MSALTLVLLASLAAPERLVVGHAPRRAADPRLDTLLDATGGAQVMRLPFARVLDVDDAERAMALLARSPLVRWVERDRLIPVRLRAPADRCWPKQWHLHARPDPAAAPGAALELERAWLYATGLDPHGAAVRVAVVDDGFDLAHPDLAARFVLPGLDVAQEPSDDDPSASGRDVHGTQTAGVIAASSEDLEGVTGVCPRCELLPIRLTGGGGPDDLYVSGAAAAEALVWAVDHGAAVINNSWGPPDGNPYTPFAARAAWALPKVLSEALGYAAREGRGGLGTLVTWAAGNGGELVTYDGFASDPRVLAIGAVAASDRLAFYSDWGPPLFAVAPSSGDASEPAIWTTDLSGAAGLAALAPASCDANDPDPCQPACLADYTGAYGGTSAASAMAAGVAALLLAAHPQLTAAQATEILARTAFPIDAARGAYADGRSPLYGFGRLDAAAAIELAATYTDECTLALEVCANGLDDDCNGVVDDPERCAPCVPDAGRELCDGADNDCDGLVDEEYVCLSSGRPPCAPCTSSAQCALGSRCRGTPDFPGTWCFLECLAGEACPEGHACNGEVCALEPDDAVLSCFDVLRGLDTGPAPAEPAPPPASEDEDARGCAAGGVGALAALLVVTILRPRRRHGGGPRGCDRGGATGAGLGVATAAAPRGRASGLARNILGSLECGRSGARSPADARPETHPRGAAASGFGLAGARE